MEFNALMKAIKAYYGDDSVAASFAHISDAQGFITPGTSTVEAQELAKAMEQIPNVNVVRAANGKIIRMEYTGTEYATQSTANTLASAANSNVGSAITNTVDEAGNVATKVKAPVNIETETQAGKTVATNAASGAMKAGHLYTGPVTVADVLGPIAAVGTGIALGKKIDSTLYNLNPDFWEDSGMGALNPETWDNITSEEDGVAGRLFNMLFGINTTTGVTQPYLDQNAVAYLTAYMLSQGVFDVGETYYEQSAGQSLHYNIYGRIYASDTSPVWDNFAAQQPRQLKLENISGVKYFFRDWGYVNFYVVSENNFSGLPIYISYDGGNTWSRYGTTTSPVTITQYGKTYYVLNYNTQNTITEGVGTIPYIEVNQTEETTSYVLWDVCDIIFNGTETQGGSGVTGIEDQTGATVFNPSGLPDDPSISDILSALQTQYPNMFTNSITNTVVDPETGEVVTTTYLPVGYPEFDPDNMRQPTGELSTQANPAYDPDTYPDISDMIAQLISYLPQYNPETQQDELTKDEVDTTNPPDTGNGTSPGVVVPTGSARALFAVYNPTQEQVNDFGAWLWSTNFVDQLKKIFNNPMESIISLHKIFATPATGTAQDIYVGYLDSGVSSATVTDQYTTVDCGSVRMQEYFGNVYDYVDTSIDLYLPFVGIVPMNVSDIMRATISVKYRVDVLTGACLVDVTVSRDLSEGVLYQYSGDCAVHYPVSAGSYMGIVSGVLSLAGGIAGTIATHGAMLPALIGAGGAAMRLHKDVTRGGGFSGNAGAMGAKKPYFIISRPQTALPDKYKELEGIGSNQTVLLSTCQGYSVIKDVRLKNIGATDGELNQIESLLKEGVIV